MGLAGREILRVVYSDESGIGDDSQPITVVTAILLNLDSQWFPISTELTALLRRVPRKLLYGEERELKGSLLFKGFRGKIRGVPKHQAGEILEDILLIAARNRAQIFYGAIDRQGYKAFLNNFSIERVQTDEEAALDECLKRLDGYAETAFPNERILWIADRCGYEKSMKSGLAHFQFLQVVDSETLIKLSGGKLAGRAIRAPRPSHVVDTIYFGDSKESLALQLVDVCCATITQSLLGTEDGRAFYRIIRQSVVTDSTPIVYSEAWGGDNVRPKH